MSWLHIFFVLFFLILNVSSFGDSLCGLKDFISNSLKIQQCSFEIAKNCFIKGNFGTRCILEGETLVGYYKTTETYSKFKKCIAPLLKNLTTAKNDGRLFPIEEMVDPKEKYYFEKYYKVSVKSEENLIIQNACKVALTFQCFTYSHCFIKSHYSAIIDVIHACQNETSKKETKKFWNNLDPENSEVSSTKTKFFAPSKLESITPPISTTTLKPKNIFNLNLEEDEEKKNMSFIGQLTIDQLKNIKKYGKNDPNFKRLIYE